MDIVMLILYLAVLVCQIFLLIRCIRNPSQRGWTLLYALEILPLGIALLLTWYFDSLPGFGMMPGLTYLGEVLFSMGAAALYGIMLLLSLLAGGLTLLKKGWKGPVNRRRFLRLMALLMFIIAVIFVVCALSCPTLGTAVYIGPFYFGASQWRKCYAAYVIIMCALFIASFFVPKKK